MPDHRTYAGLFASAPVIWAMHSSRCRFAHFVCRTAPQDPQFMGVSPGKVPSASLQARHRVRSGARLSAREPGFPPTPARDGPFMPVTGDGPQLPAAPPPLRFALQSTQNSSGGVTIAEQKGEPQLGTVKQESPSDGLRLLWGKTH